MGIEEREDEDTPDGEILDLHCHVFPVEAVRGATPSITVKPEGDGYRYTDASRSMLLDRGLFDLEAQRQDMERQGVSRRALAVPPFTLGYFLPPDEGRRWTRAINDGIAAIVERQRESFIGFAAVPMQDVPSAISELDYAVSELGLHGVEIATNINGVELDAPTLDPFWECAQHHNVPILIHPHDVAGEDRMRRYYLNNLVGNPVETALAGARLIFGGVLDRFPGLTIILSHGGGALPQIIGRLQHGSTVRTEARHLSTGPVAQIRRLYFDTIVFDARALRHLVATAGASQVVLGTDYPFDMGEPDPVRFVRGAGLSDEDARTILANGARLLA